MKINRETRNKPTIYRFRFKGPSNVSSIHSTSFFYSIHQGNRQHGERMRIRNLFHAFHPFSFSSRHSHLIKMRRKMKKYMFMSEKECGQVKVKINWTWEPRTGWRKLCWRAGDEGREIVLNPVLHGFKRGRELLLLLKHIKELLVILFLLLSMLRLLLSFFLWGAIKVHSISPSCPLFLSLPLLQTFPIQECIHCYTFHLLSPSLSPFLLIWILFKHVLQHFSIPLTISLLLNGHQSSFNFSSSSATSISHF